MRRGGSPYNALSEGCSLGRADPPQEDEGMGDNTEMGTLAVNEELHDARGIGAVLNRRPYCFAWDKKIETHPSHGASHMPDGLMAQLGGGLLATSPLEALAVLSSLVYVV